ncbi:ATP-binding cassette domain-containing protein [Nocardioides sp. AE5]|uniref:ABC transporter ATP-binding protein n=1 Tax=Nocardioides sp. AE5 TaxID=2962573 RepID=UPI0028828591|nr:ATP-binding cassette domain-containing protein [Nocardioides sp. AE5]MDT0200412.1 ATP-binding cassette domain-containing protein [Nocardioides sp. AE5]
METEVVVQARAVGKSFRGSDGEPVTVLKDVSLTVRRGQVAVVTGPSGAGKSVFLQVIAGLEPVDSGTVTVADNELTELGDRALTAFRRSEIGFASQIPNLLPHLSARDNVLLPLKLAGRAVEETLLAELADRVGLAGRLHHHPAELSAGQQARVQMIRAILVGPEVLLADDPTAFLDADSAGLVLDLLDELVTQHGLTAIIATRDPALLRRADRIRRLANGRAVGADGKPLRPKRRPQPARAPAPAGAGS